jgi:hypothetical protein
MSIPSNSECPIGKNGKNTNSNKDTTNITPAQSVQQAEKPENTTNCKQ